MLRSETNTQKVRSQIYDAACEILKDNNLQTAFEHGQWWVTVLTTGAQYSVNDADGNSDDIVNGFCLEEVTRGEED